MQHTKSLARIVSLPPFSLLSKELPLHILQLEGRDVVHVAPEGRASWAQQEARCKRGDGNLVSLSTLQEETLLVRTLTRNTTQQPANFWLGLNLCQTYKGEAQVVECRQVSVQCRA